MVTSPGDSPGKAAKPSAGHLGTEYPSEKGKAFFVFRQTRGDHDRRGALPPYRGLLPLIPWTFTGLAPLIFFYGCFILNKLSGLLSALGGRPG
jgi:hypothetical protein